MAVGDQFEHDFHNENPKADRIKGQEHSAEVRHCNFGRFHSQNNGVEHDHTKDKPSDKIAFQPFGERISGHWFGFQR